jgi:tetratricopeptide (TPR) repeat protein
MRRAFALLSILSGLIVAACAPNAETNNNANALYEQGRFESAVRQYQSAQVISPDSPEAYNNSAIALAVSGKYDDAIEALSQALKTADESMKARIYYNLGNVYFEQGHYPDAVEAYKQTLLRNPNDDDARYNLELAQFYILNPTATAQEQKTEPDQGETDREATPTNNPSGLDGPTPTPPPQEGPPDLSATPVTGSGEPTGTFKSTPQPEEGGPITIEDAQKLLDSVEQNQETMREYLEELATEGPSSGNDW